MDNNAIYQTLDSIKNEIYQKIKENDLFLLDENTTTTYINTIENLKTRWVPFKKNEDKKQIDSYKELILIYLNEILIIHKNIFKTGPDTKFLENLNQQFINDAIRISHMVKPSDTRKADDKKKADDERKADDKRKVTRPSSIKNTDTFSWNFLDDLQEDTESYTFDYPYPREQPKPKSNTVSCDKYSKKYKTIPFNNIKQLKNTITYNINKIDNFKNNYKTQISNIINNPNGEKKFWSEFSVIPPNFEEDNIRDLVNKKNTSNTLFDRLNPFSVRNTTSRKIKKIKKKNKYVEHSILQKYRDVLQGIYNYINNNMFEKWPNIDINKFYQEYSTICNSEKLYKISEKNITNFKFNNYDLNNWHTYYNNLNDFNYNVLSNINLSIEGLCLLQEEFEHVRFDIMNYFIINDEMRKLKMELESLNTKLEEKNNALNTVQSEQNTTADELTSKIKSLENKLAQIEYRLQDLVNKEFFSQKYDTIISDIFTLCHINQYIIKDWKKLKFDIINKINSNPINSNTKQLNNDDKEQLRILEEEINSIYNRDKTQQISSKLQSDKKVLEELLLRKKREILKKYIKERKNTNVKWDPAAAIGGRKRKTRRKRKRRRKTRRKGKKRRKKRKTRRKR